MAGLPVGEFGAPEPLVGHVSEPWGEAVAEDFEQPEHRVGVPSVISRDHLRFHPAVEVEQGIQMNSEYRTVPGTSIAPIPETWSLTALSHVRPACSGRTWAKEQR